MRLIRLVFLELHCPSLTQSCAWTALQSVHKTKYKLEFKRRVLQFTGLNYGLSLHVDSGLVNKRDLKRMLDK